MMTADARQEAVAWAVQAQDADFDDWEKLADWLAADPSHAEFYDRITLAADEAARSVELLDAPVTARSPKLSRSPVVPHALTAHRKRRPWLPFAIAAGLIGTIGTVGWLSRDHGKPVAFYAESTSAGERRMVAIGNTVRMELGGDTRILLDRSNPHVATIDRGEALFAVSHDPGHPFGVRVGNALITDVGTVFNVDRQPDATIVSVAEGKVRVTVPAGAIDVSAGQSLTISREAGRITRHAQDPATVGAWRSGRIDFADMTIKEIANRIHRITGANIETASGVADRRAAGSIRIDNDITTTFRTLGPMLGIAIARHGDDWTWDDLRGENSS